MDTFEAIQNRRSIRKYKTDPVDEKTLTAVLDAARLAPSWDNSQCWKFIVIRDAVIKGKIADAILPHPALHANPSTNAVRNAPVLIVAIAEKGFSGCFDRKTASEKGEYWYMFDVALAMENLVLAATALGLGTVHVGLFDVNRVMQILGIPDQYTVVEMTPLGYPEKQPAPRPRKNLNEIVFYEKFGQK
jgi:nitroreductase